MPREQTGLYKVKGVVRQAKRPRQSAGASSLPGGPRGEEIPAAPGQAGEAVGLGYSGRTTPSRLEKASGAERATVTAAQMAPLFPRRGRTKQAYGHLRSNQSMEPTSGNRPAPPSRELLRTSRAVGRETSPTSALAGSVAHL